MNEPRGFQPAWKLLGSEGGLQEAMQRRGIFVASVLGLLAGHVKCSRNPSAVTSHPVGSLPDSGLFAEGWLWEAPWGWDPSSAQ